MKHHKHKYPFITFYTQEAYQEPQADQWALSHLAHQLDGGRPTLFDDGDDNDNPYRVLPLERWRDRGTNW